MKADLTTVAVSSRRLVRADSGDHAPVSLSAVSRLLAGLDREQRRAVTHGEGTLAVVAGPGTGKTEIITRRVAWLIATKRARPSEILALTFTDRAADEMQARVDVLVPYGQAQSVIGTFHAFGDRLIREFGYQLGLSADPRVIGVSEQVVLLQEHLFSLGLDRFAPLGDPTRFLVALADRIGRAKEAGLSGPHLLERAVAASGERAAIPEPRQDVALSAVAQQEEVAAQLELARAQVRYEQLLAERGLVDFADQVGLAVRLLRERPVVRAELRSRFRYIVVDEYQDTNALQLELLGLIGGSWPNLTVVGDDDQAIYTFRGATAGSLFAFGEAFPSASTVSLRRTYRSLAPIVRASQRLIRFGGAGLPSVSEALEARLMAVRRGRRCPPVSHQSFGTAEEEADWMAKEVVGRLQDGARVSDFCVLVRTNADAQPILRSFAHKGVPVRSGAGTRLFMQPEVRDLLSFLRVVNNPDSSVDLYGVATGSPYGLGGTDLTQIVQSARRRHRSLWSVVGELCDQPGVLRLSAISREALTRLRRDLTTAMEESHRRPAGEVLYEHLKRTGRLRDLVAQAERGDDAPLRHVARFFELIRSHAALLTDERLSVLGRHLDALATLGQETVEVEDLAPDAVSVLTVHKAKGLEFPVVFLPGLVDGRFPQRGRADRLPSPARSGRNSPEDVLSEERRLLFVAMTRARDELHLSWARRSSSGRAQRPSQFLAEALDLPFAVLQERPEQSAADLANRLIAGQASLRVASSPPQVPVRRPSNAALTLSFSQIDDYLTCPLKYQLRHELGVPTPAHHALAVGNALHQAAAAFHLARRRGTVFSPPELVSVLSDHWSSEGFISRDHEEARFASARDAVLRLRETELRPDSPLPIGVEKPFSVRLGRDTIRGRYDRLDESPEGIVITDYKSSDMRSQQKADDRARDSLQLGVYALAHQAETGQLPAAVQLHFLESGLTGRVIPEPSRLERTRNKVTQAADGIRAADFSPKPSFIACGYCPYRSICPQSAA